MYAVSEKDFHQGASIRVKFLSENIARVQIAPPGAKFKDSSLNRYGFITEADSGDVQVDIAESKEGFSAQTSRLSIKGDNSSGEIEISDLKTKRTLLHQKSFEFKDNLANVLFKAAENEDWLGFGDQTRERLFHRGHTADCFVTNVKSYIPVPFFMSTNGVGVLVNSAHRVFFDMCNSDPDNFFWQDARGCVDYYVMVGEGYKELLDLYTDLTGKPKLPPEWSFGLWYICRTQANDYEAVNDALNFRKEKIPCDVIGLEPGWMEKDYDLSIEKEWSKERFPIPNYCFNGPHNFFNSIKRMGYKLELWLCNEYDLSFEEERRLGKVDKEEAKESDSQFHEMAEIDEHFSWPRYSDQLTKRDEPWFEHLKKFVDQGADFFKQDGAFQVCKHPDRIWGNGMLDDEMHNIYPLFYSRQMYEGFEEHAKRRPVVFTPSGWAGFQAWCGTWTGDTGGRLDTLGAMLNTSIVGHSWSTNDMEVMQREGVHFGYLQPWSQINSWNYFRMPWLQGDEICNLHKFYSNFRARLIPYIYSWAYQATKNAWPLMLPLALEFPKDENCRENLHQYLLGRDLLVGIYKDEIYFPAGMWKDYWTGEVCEGLQDKKVSWPDDRGGALYVREGGIIPFGPVMQYRGEKPLNKVSVYVFPGPAKSSFELYEDDGVSFEHLKGHYSITKISAVKEAKSSTVEIGEADGNFEGMVKDREWEVVMHADSEPNSVWNGDMLLNEKDISWDRKRKELTVRNISVPAKVTAQF